MSRTNSEPDGATIERGDPRSAEATLLLDALSRTLARITGSSGNASFDITDVEGPRSLFLMAYDRDRRPVGCGSYRPHSASEAEIKRMLALPGTRGVGAGLLAALEQAALNDGYRAVICETRRINERAVAFYSRHGYAVIPNFGRYQGRTEAVCFGKQLMQPV